MEIRQRNVNKKEEDESFSFSGAFKNFDVISTKVDEVTEEEYTSQTWSGAFVTIAVVVIMCLLFINETKMYLDTKYSEHMQVDTKSGSNMVVDFNITFDQLRCSTVHLDVVDKGGKQFINYAQNLYKQRLSPAGHKIGNAQKVGLTPDPKDDPTEGCRMWGNVRVNKVAGNLHVALGGSSGVGTTRHVHQFERREIPGYKATHTIHHFGFSEHNEDSEFTDVEEVPASMKTAITDLASDPPVHGVPHYQYFVKVIPSVWIDLNKREKRLFQLSYTQHMHVITADAKKLTSQNLPGVFFYYDMSPFLVEVTATKMPFIRYVTNVCALIGGVFTVAGLLTSVITACTSVCSGDQAS